MQPRAIRAIEALLDKGVSIPNPLSLDIGPEVDVDRISADGVTIHPGCRIRGGRTVISAGVTLGSEGPVTIEDCRLGPNVSLKGGYAANAVFLDGASLGLGHQVREGTLLEEEANGAHCVGLKQTILFPFVTLGSLINFCDCLMSGGTGRSDHSEVGSSYVHFNFTPRGDKATASLFGDVARGVMLREPPIFLGGQGGAVGPVMVGYGSVVAAGSVLRSDVPDGQLTIVAPPASKQAPVNPGSYRDVSPAVAKNAIYIANLRALQEWYQRARSPFFAAQEFGELIYEGALEMLAAAMSERSKRLQAMVANVSPGQVTQARPVPAPRAHRRPVPDTPRRSARHCSARGASHRAGSTGRHRFALHHRCPAAISPERGHRHGLAWRNNSGTVDQVGRPGPLAGRLVPAVTSTTGPGREVSRSRHARRASRSG